jgi:hypothetical protein
MKVVVYGEGEAPRGVKAVQTAQVHTEEDLYELVYNLSGGEFVIVVLARDAERVALAAAQVAAPTPKVVLAGRGQLMEVVRAGEYRPYAMTC